MEDVRDLARLEANRLKLRPEPFDLASKAEEVANSLRPAMADGGVSCDVLVLHPVRVHADPTRIGQVLYNFIGTATKFTPAGGAVTVAVRSENQDAILEVTDTGRGLTPDEISRLFEPFSQAHNPEGMKDKGTGLGLFISKGIVEQHGGSVWCRSMGLGKGSVFGFRIPAIAS